MINLLILDECHHATGEHPMRKVMHEYERLKSANKAAPLPRILGLTACVIHKKLKPFQVENCMRQLEVALDSTLKTSYDQDKVKEFTTRPQEIFLLYDEPQYSQYQQKIMTELNAIIENIEEKVDLEKNAKKDLTKIIKNIIHIMQELGDWCVGRAIKYEIEDFQDKMENEYVPCKRGLLKEIKESLQIIYLMCYDEEKVLDPEQDTSPKVQINFYIMQKKKKISCNFSTSISFQKIIVMIIMIILTMIIIVMLVMIMIMFIRILLMIRYNNNDNNNNSGVMVIVIIMIIHNNNINNTNNNENNNK
ncbi:unnamed protein product [Meganyctiphanes norvegica]|uniref:Uncharacterized protein n=1 Tax=Meganyctiphanes norvegica TaxID=48144 RepID=A0AAV2RW70_MEGNR